MGTVAVFLCGSIATAYAQTSAPAPGAAPDGAPAQAAPPVAPQAVPAQAGPGNYPAPPAGAYAPGPGYPAPAPGGYGPAPGYYYPPPPAGYYAAQPMAPPPGYHEHDGFYLRMTMGVGYLHTSYSVGTSDLTISGGGMALSIAVGGAIMPNLILYGEITGTSALNPTFSTATGSATGNGTVSLVGLGPGAAYYIEPTNMYVSGTLAFSQVSASDSNSNNSTDLTNTGIGFALSVGKEWWASPNWGVGVAGMFHFASMTVKNANDTRMTAEGISILFSATYN